MAEENAGSIVYTVDIDTDNMLGAQKNVTKGLDDLQKQMGQTDTAAKRTENQMTKLATSVRAAAVASDSSTSSFTNLVRVLGGLASIQGVRTLIDMAERYGEMAERIGMATDSAEEYAQVQARLLSTANATYRPLSEAQELYIRTAKALKSMGYNTSGVLDITDSFSFSLVKNAASAERAEGALSAYAKSIQTGKVQADQWESITSAMPTIIEDIAKAANMSSAEIRALGAAGKLTASQLNEGLRQSLDENKKAADGMAVTVKDAYNSLINNLTVYVGELNKAEGATSLISSTIVALGENIEAVSKVVAIGAVAALTQFAAAQGAALLGAAKLIIANRAQAVETLRLAAAEETAAGAAVMRARANVGLGTTATTLTAAETGYQAALARTAAAQTAVAGTGRVLLGVLGGPVGIIVLLASAAAAFLLFRDNAKSAKPPVDDLTVSVDKLSAAQVKLAQINNAEKIAELEKLAKNAAGIVDYYAAMAKAGKEDQTGTKWYAEQVVVLEQTNAQLAELKKRQEDLAASVQSRAPEAGAAPAASETTPGGQERIKALNDELALAKEVGRSRAMLAAQQKLGADATEKEIATARDLAGQIYDLETARKTEAKTATKASSDKEAAAKRAAKAESDGIQQNIKQFEELGIRLAAVSMSGREVAMMQAQLSLNQYATPEQIENVRQLAAAVYDLEQKKANREKYGEDPAATIRGTVTPLSGGEFDNQDARYQAEADSETKRYADQLERLRKAKEAQVEVTGGYQALEEQMATEHSARMAQIEQARTQMMLANGENLFGSLADAAKNYAGEQSGIYKALFAASKAFAIADATIKISQGIAAAASLGFPAGIPAMASVAAATAGLISNISSVTMTGRALGGPVDAANMYRVNEGGAPEVFNAANGQQYMLPNQRGDVVSNKDATGNAGGAPIYVTITVNSDGTSTATSSSNATDDSKAMAQGIRVVVQDELERQSRQGGIIWRQRNGS